MSNDKTMMRKYDSPIFGPARDATDDEKKMLAEMAKEIPVAMFQAINPVLLERGIICTFGPHPDYKMH